MHVVLYTWSSCSFCARARELLKRHALPFEERALDGDRPTAERLARRLGRAAMPYALVEGELLGGLEALEDRLAREAPDGPGTGPG